MENEDDDILNTTGLPNEIAGEVKVFNIRNDEIQKMTSDGEGSFTYYVITDGGSGVSKTLTHDYGGGGRGWRYDDLKHK